MSYPQGERQRILDVLDSRVQDAMPMILSPCARVTPPAGVL